MTAIAIPRHSGYRKRKGETAKQTMLTFCAVKWNCLCYNSRPIVLIHKHEIKDDIHVSKLSSDRQWLEFIRVFSKSELLYDYDFWIWFDCSIFLLVFSSSFSLMLWPGVEIGVLVRGFLTNCFRCLWWNVDNVRWQSMIGITNALEASLWCRFPGFGSVTCFFWFWVSSLLMLWPESGGWSDVIRFPDALLDRESELFREGC